MNVSSCASGLLSRCLPRLRVRVVGEEMESVKDRAAVFFAENNPDQSTFFIQAVYGVD